MDMDAEALVTEDIVKIEVEEVGFQAVETDTKLFELSNASGNLIFKCDTNENTKNAVSDRVPVPEITDQINIKSEPEEVKVESCLDNSEKYSVLEIMKEFVIKYECNDDDMFLGTTTETVSNSTLKQKTMVKQQSVACKKLSKNLVYCHSCNYSARSKYILVSHMKEHRDLKKHNNVQGSSYKHNTCIHCNAKYSCKMTLDNHVIRKHSDLVASVSSKTHECSHCAYKTTIKSSYRKHMLKHSKTASKYKSDICTHCNAEFKSKRTLYEHIIREHPDFITSLPCKLYHCTRCSYKTTIKYHLPRHMLYKHSESVGNYKFSICIHCNAKFKTKNLLDNHILKHHPDFIASVSSRIHECKHCEYKTTIKNCLASHALKHPESVDNYKFTICIHCKAKFKCMPALNDHLIKKHPHFIPLSVSSKMHECTHCAYKSLFKSKLDRHMSKHSKLPDNHKFIICIHCDAKLKSTQTLNDHIVRRHPDFIASISAKIHECACCAYKTVKKSDLATHMKKKHSKFIAAVIF